MANGTSTPGWPARRQIGVAFLRLRTAQEGAADLVGLRAGRRRQRIGMGFAALAAGLVLAAGLSAWVLTLKPRPASVTYATTVGERSLAPLEDGSRLELNTDTAISVSVDARHRAVHLLRGEVFFAVAHDASRPFVITAGDERITVLGTRFSVRHTGAGVRIMVEEGRVKLESIDGSKAPVVLTAAQVALTEPHAALVTRTTAAQVKEALGWRTGQIVFHDATLAEAAAEFNRYNRTRLVITSPDVAAIRIGGSFDTKGVDAFAALLRDAFGLTVTERDGALVVSS